MHKCSYFYKFYHAEHHRMTHIRATDSIRHTAVDGTIDVLCSVIALKLSRAHYYSRTIYNMIAIWLIVEAHSGMNCPWMLQNILPYPVSLVYAGPVVHDIHHRKGTVNFQKYFTYLDFFCGTLCLQDEMKINSAD